MSIRRSAKLFIYQIGRFFNGLLGRIYTNTRFARPDADQTRDVGVLTRDFGEVSQYHQGAGEDATLDLFRILQNVPDTSLLVIDEIEASLHPRAQRRLIRFLLWLARQKRIQVILSTHSPYVLEELPAEARILLLPGPVGISVVYGSSPEFAMSRLDDAMHPELHVFVEDRQAQVMVREMIAAASNGHDILPRLNIVPVGPSNVVKILGNLATTNKLPYKAIAILDGDEESADGCLMLPGENAPERVVFCALKAADWKNIPERFDMGAGNLLTHLEDAILSQTITNGPKLRVTVS